MRQIPAILFLSACAAALHAQPGPGPGAALGPSPDLLLERKLLLDIEALDRSLGGVLGIAAVDLATGRIVTYHADTPFPTASSIKVAILAQMFLDANDGKLQWDAPVALSQKDVVGGSGYLHRLLRRREGLTISVRELAEAMIEDSDNYATNRAIDIVGMDRVNAMLQAHGLASIRLQRKMMDTTAARAGRENMAAPRDLVRLMQMLWDGSLLGKQASIEAIEILKRVEADMRRAIPDSVPVAAKPGELDWVRCEAGLVLLPRRPFALVVMSSYLGELENPVPRVTRLVYSYFDKLEHSNGTGRKLD